MTPGFWKYGVSTYWAREEYERSRILGAVEAES